MKRYIPFLLAIVIIGAASQAVFKQDSSSEYNPRTVQIAQGADGAHEIRQAMLRDPLTGEVNYDYIGMVEADLKKFGTNNAFKNNGEEWISAGPNNVGGRTRGIHTDTDNPDRVFIGGVSGGVFQSINGGEEWSKVEGFNDNLAVSTITRAGNGTLYVGTGHWREDFRGHGVYSSSDDGETWVSVDVMSPSGDLVSDQWSTINVVKADPNDDNRIWVGAAGGLWTYDSDTDDLNEVLTFSCPSLSISEDGMTIVANSGNRVYVSIDGGDTFENRSGTGFFEVPNSGVGRMEVAVSPDNPDYIYVIQVTPFVNGGADYPACGGHMKGFYASTDRGLTWTELYGSSGGTQTTTPFQPFVNPSVNCQGLYDCAISVMPGSPDKVIIGGIRMYIIELSGTNPPTSQWSSLNINFSNGPNPLYVHSDIHTFHWDANDELYVCGDGGIFKSFDYAQSYVPANYNYRTTQFYGIDYSNRGAIIGGTQDNGTHLVSGFNISNNDSDEVGGGDGFDCGISKYNSELAYVTSQNGAIFRTLDGGLSASEFALPAGEADQAQPFWTVIDHYEVLDASNALVQEFTWNPDFLTAEESYLIGDTLIFSEETCFNGESYESGDTLIFDEDFTQYYLAPGASHPYTGSNYNIQYEYTNNTGENLYINCPIAAPDPAQSFFCYGTGGSFYFTRDAFKTSVASGNIQWTEVTGISGTAISFEFSPDGDKIYCGTSSGRVYRIDGLNNDASPEADQAAANNKTTIYSGSGAIRDMAVDFNNPNRLAICRPGYSNIDHVEISDVAGTTSNDDSFENAWNPPGNLSLMPVYSVQFDISTPNRIFAGTEYGTFVSDDLGDSWEECNSNMGRVPVYALEQQVLTQDDMINGSGEIVYNEGAMYAGTFGGGLFYLGSYVLGVEDFEDDATSLNLNIYPNPMNSVGVLNLDLDESANISINILDISGKVIKTMPQGRMSAGEHTIQFGVREFAEGTYLLNVISEGRSAQTSRFVISRQ